MEFLFWGGLVLGERATKQRSLHFALAKAMMFAWPAFALHDLRRVFMHVGCDCPQSFREAKSSDLGICGVYDGGLLYGHTGNQ